jgi:hypothetical protein
MKNFDRADHLQLHKKQQCVHATRRAFIDFCRVRPTAKRPLLHCATMKQVQYLKQRLLCKRSVKLASNLHGACIMDRAKANRVRRGYRAWQHESGTSVGMGFADFAFAYPVVVHRTQLWKIGARRMRMRSWRNKSHPGRERLWMEPYRDRLQVTTLALVLHGAHIN